MWFETFPFRGKRKVDKTANCVAAAAAFWYQVCVGAFSEKEDTPMKHFLRDVLAAFVAAVLAALVIRLLNL